MPLQFKPGSKGSASLTQEQHQFTLRAHAIEQLAPQRDQRPVTRRFLETLLFEKNPTRWNAHRGDHTAARQLAKNRVLQYRRERPRRCEPDYLQERSWPDGCFLRRADSEPPSVLLNVDLLPRLVVSDCAAHSHPVAWNTRLSKAKQLVERPVRGRKSIRWGRLF